MTVNANPTCSVCARSMVLIGHRGNGPPWACPKDCSECVACKRPGAQLKTVSELTEERDAYAADAMVWGGWFGGGAKARYLVSNCVCTICGSTTIVEKCLP